MTTLHWNLASWLLAAGLVAAAGLVGPTDVVALSSAVGVLPAPPHAFAGAQPRRGSPREFPFEDRLTLPALVSHSDTIVTGEVLDLKPSWNAERSEIFTTVILRVDRRLKGSGGEVIRFSIPGGTVGDEWIWITHAPRFELGERALVFLRSGGGRLPTVVGMEAGKRPLAADEDGSERIRPEFHWNPGGARPAVALATVEELAAALPRLEAQALSRRRD